jgi:hypothetical protein
VWSFQQGGPKRSTENKQPRVNTVEDDEQYEEEYLLHCFEFADNEYDWIENCGAGGSIQVGDRCLVQGANKAFSRYPWWNDFKNGYQKVGKVR